MQENRIIWHDTQKHSTVKINMIGWRRGINHKLWGAKGEQQVNAIEATPRILSPQISSPTLYNSKLIFAGCLNCFAKPVPGWLVKIDAHSPWPLCPALKASLPAIAITLWQVLPKIRCIAVSYSKHKQVHSLHYEHNQWFKNDFFQSHVVWFVRPSTTIKTPQPAGAMAVPGIILNP